MPTDFQGDAFQADPDLTKFQLRILGVLAEEARYGLAIKRELEAYYGTDVNHGRLYPNLNDLIEADHVEKSELDKRTNLYALTDVGREALTAELGWIANRLDVRVVPDSGPASEGGGPR